MKTSLLRDASFFPGMSALGLLLSSAALANTSVVTKQSGCAVVVSGGDYVEGDAVELFSERRSEETLLGTGNVDKVSLKGNKIYRILLNKIDGECVPVKRAKVRLIGSKVEAASNTVFEVSFKSGIDMVDKLAITNAQKSSDDNNAEVSQRDSADAKGSLNGISATVGVRFYPFAMFMTPNLFSSNFGMDASIRYSSIFPDSKTEGGSVSTSTFDYQAGLLWRFTYGKNDAFTTYLLPATWVSRSVTHTLKGVPSTFAGISTANLALDGLAGGIGQSMTFGNAHVGVNVSYAYLITGTVAFPLGSGISAAVELDSPRGLLVDLFYIHQLFGRFALEISGGYESINGPVKGATYSDEYGSKRILGHLGARWLF